MRALRFLLLAGTIGVVIAVTGCGPSKAEREATERARLEAEEASQRDAAIANKAITGMNQKLGRKPPELDLGVAPDKKPEPAKPVDRKP